MAEPEKPPVVSIVSQAPATVAQNEEIVLLTAGQRRVNLIWEVTQALLAVTIVSGTVFVTARLILAGGDEKNAESALLLLSNAFFFIVTSYFARTNHTKVGGSGPPSEMKGQR